MSPRTTEAAGPTNDIHAVPPAPAIVELKRAPSSTVAPDDRFDASGFTRIPASRQRRAGKPLSSGWKSLAWTTPPPPPAEGGRRSSSPPTDRASFGMPLHHSSPGGTASNTGLPQIVAPVGGGIESDKIRSAVRRTTSQGDELKQGSRRQYPPYSGKRSGREGYLVGIAEGSDSRSPNLSSLAPARTATSIGDGVQTQPIQQQQKNHSSSSFLGGSSTELASSEGEGRQAQQAQQAKTLANFLLTTKSADSSVPLKRAPLYPDSPEDDVITRSMPNQPRRQASTDEEGNVVFERSLSDTSIVTASDFAPSKPNKPVILTHMKDDDAIEELVELLARGKGLSVVKHATGLGGSKSRKMLRFNNVEGSLSVCGMLPPYFKTKIPVRDIDRVDAKWCCVVVHAKGRSPVRIKTQLAASLACYPFSKRHGLHRVLDARSPPFVWERVDFWLFVKLSARERKRLRVEITWTELRVQRVISPITRMFAVLIAAARVCLGCTYLSGSCTRLFVTPASHLSWAAIATLCIYDELV